MASVNDGGPAFPFITWRSPDGMIGMNAADGMSLRDYFAIHASDEDVRACSAYWTEDGGYLTRTREEARYAFADAMIAARGGKVSA